ncbi:hypothetical protein SAMN02983003_0137 [Devosia enhydra]|uniref:Transcriptional regulator n=1 Tax=Devosia enhydra TaxID=665118 RepID=A0A1K2HSL0_9HYPH|nr:hypothetical protein [Devosia enhydra]SFZ80795.1 hypothetical protein SAMN02983003_0137 [Devosia enhydra]
MSIPVSPAERQPKGDHNRRLSLGMEPDAFAAAAGITLEELREYELTSPDHRYNPEVARRIGETLDRLEANPPNTQRVEN